VSLVSDVQHGTLTLSSDGSFLYIPTLLFTGTDSFTYRVSSPGGSATGLVTLTIGGANVDTRLMATHNGNDKTAPYQLSSGNFTATSGAVYLVFVGHTAAAGDTATLSATGDVTVNGGPIATATMPSVAGGGALNYGWVWEVDGTGGNTSSLTADFANPNAKSAGADVMQVVQVNSGTYPPYVGNGTVVPPGSALVSNHSATVTLTSPSFFDSEVSFLYVDSDIGGSDPGWSTAGISTFSGSFLHAAGANGYGSIVGYAPNALSSATTGHKFPGVDGVSYIAISFELKP
jgi:hypothetical protein